MGMGTWWMGTRRGREGPLQPDAMKGTDRAAAVTGCLDGKCVMRRRRRGQGQQAAVRAVLAMVWAGCVLLGLVTVPGAGGYTIEKRRIGQSSACVSSFNTITVTYKTDTSLSWAGLSTARITISGIAPTSSPPAYIRLTDFAYVFSGTAILYQAVDATAGRVIVDNSVDKGIKIGDDVRVEDEVMLVNNVTGVGCDRTSVVDSACWNVLIVERGQRGSQAVAHAPGALVHTVIAGTLLDEEDLSDETLGLQGRTRVLNLDSVRRFEGPTSGSDMRYLYVNQEVMSVDLVHAEEKNVQGSGSDRTVQLWANASSETDFYTDMDIVMLDGVAKGQRRKILSYDGATKEATLYLPWTIQPAPGDRYSINAVKIERSVGETGSTPIVIGTGANTIVIQVGLEHPKNSTVYFTNTTYTWLRQPTDVWPGQTWSSGGFLTLSLMANTLASLTKIFAFTVVNYNDPQAPSLVRIQGDEPIQLMLNDPQSTTFPTLLPTLTCDPGTFMTSGQVTCTQCSVGQASRYCGGPSCTDCEAGTYSAVVGATHCADCEPGYYCLGAGTRNGCEAGTYSNAGMTFCYNCTAGYACPGSSDRVKCSAGTYQANTHQSACIDCPAGNFSRIEAQTYCEACAAGDFSPSRATRCSACLPGSYSPRAQSASCTPCPQSSYMPDGRATTCTDCPRNRGARIIMGICSGACGGATAKAQCLCKAGFTDFGVESDVCNPERWEVASIGQNTACRSLGNQLSVTLTANVPLTTAVQTINVIQGGYGYADGKLNVIESGSEGFEGSFGTSSMGTIESITFEKAGRWFLGNPERVEIYHGPGCAEADAGCSTTRQEGTIGRIDIIDAGSGYVDGVLALSGGGGGSGVDASFLADEDTGAITSVRFAAVSSRGSGYTQDPSVDVAFLGATRCDDGSSVVAPSSGCLQGQTITTIKIGSGMSGCRIGDVITMSGGGGAGFRATVADVTPLQSITQISIENHGTGYTSDPLVVISSALCMCNFQAGNVAGNFAACLKLMRGTNATVQARRAHGAVLEAETGSKVVIGPMPGATQPLPDSSPVEIDSNTAKSIALGTSLACGFTAKGGLLCWGQSEQRVVQSVFTWACGYSARYYRFRPIRMRSGRTTNVQITEFEFFSKGRVPIRVSGVSNPGGYQGTTAGFEPNKLIDADAGTYWKDLNGLPVIFDMGESVVLEGYRWRYNPLDQSADPLEWAVEGSDDPSGSSGWVSVHEMSSQLNSIYSLPSQFTANGIQFWPRNGWTQLFNGSCVVPEGQVWRSLSLGTAHACGINTAGAALCWGHNDWNQVVFPTQPCNLTQGYGYFGSCTSANYDSTVYRKVRISSRPGQCTTESCVNKYADESCVAKGCKPIYTTVECVDAATRMGLVGEGYYVPTYSSRLWPKGCFFLSSAGPNEAPIYFNGDNSSSTCNQFQECMCKDCPAFRFVLHDVGRYCAGSFDPPAGGELAGAKTIDQCQVACGDDESCDYFTFYDEISSVGCAPCCFKLTGECTLIDPNRVLPPVGEGTKATALWATISTGFMHTCGVDSGGGIHCWGYDRDNQASVPTIYASRKFKSVSAGKYHTCGILDDYTVQCWGASGEGSEFNVGQVYPIPGKGTIKWIEVSSGHFHTCGVTQEGDLLCWGCGGTDLLGRPLGISPWGENIDKGQCNVPSIGEHGGGKWRSVRSGLYHTCGVTKNGVGVCWGCKCNPGLCPAWNSTDVDYGQCNVPSGHVWSEIGVGQYHSCGLTHKGKVICWGCRPDISKPYYGPTGSIVDQPVGMLKRNDYGQCSSPDLKEYMNTAVFGHTARWDSSTTSLELDLKANTIPGSSYYITFPVVNPPSERPAASISISASGTTLAPALMKNALGPLAPLYIGPCRQGTYKPTPETCSPCPIGTYALDCGVSACSACNPGTYSSLGRSSCSSCQAGTFQPSPGSSACNSCSDGEYGPTVGAIERREACVACLPGTYSRRYTLWDAELEAWTSIGSDRCSPCPRGSYCPGGKDIPCPRGHWSNETGQNSSETCSECPVLDRCTGEWPRFRCITASTGVGNGSIFAEKFLCERTCFNSDVSPGECVAVEGRNDGCLPGYDGFLCSRCEPGFYPDFFKDECIECPTTLITFWYMCAYIASVLTVPLLCDLAGLDWRFAVYFRITQGFLQNMDLALSVNAQWPPFFYFFVRWLRILDGDLLLAQPQCFLGSTPSTWHLVFSMRAGLPFCIYSTLALLSVCLVPFGHGKIASRVRSSLLRGIGVFAAWYIVPQINVVLDALNCICVQPGWELFSPSWGNETANGTCAVEGARHVVMGDAYTQCSGDVYDVIRAVCVAAICVCGIGVPFTVLANVLEPQTEQGISLVGWLSVSNVGVSKGSVVGNTVLNEGSGVLGWLEPAIAEARKLVKRIEKEVVRLEEDEEDARVQGEADLAYRWMRAQERMAIALVYMEQRVTVLEARRDALQASMLQLGPGEAVEKAERAQREACDGARACLRNGIYNFVEPLANQASAWKWVMGEVNAMNYRRGVGWLQTTPGVRWYRKLDADAVREARRYEADWKAKLYLMSVRSAMALFVTPISAVLIAVYAVRYLLVDYAMERGYSPNNDQGLVYLWGDFGTKQELKGQVIHVDPLYADSDKLSNEEDLQGKIVVVYRGRGPMHEPSIIKVQRLQAAGAMAVVVVNQGKLPFMPRMVTENYADLNNVSIPVLGIGSHGSEALADGCFFSLRFARYPPMPISLYKSRWIASTTVMSPIMEVYREGFRWWECLIVVRKVALCYIRARLIESPMQQASLILGFQFLYAMLLIAGPFREKYLNRMEMASAFASLASSLAVALVISLFGGGATGKAGVMDPSAASGEEAAGRMLFFEATSWTIIGLLLLTGSGLLAATLMTFISLLVSAIKDYFHVDPSPPPPPEPEPPVPEPSPIKPLVGSCLEAIEELERVLPLSCISQCAYQSACQAVREADEQVERRAFLPSQAIQRRPWVYLLGKGAAGVHLGKPVIILKHRGGGGGLLVELPAASQGEVRFRMGTMGPVRCVMHDLVIWTRDSFFAPSLARAIDRPPREGEKEPNDASSTPDVGRWRVSQCHPDIVITHTVKSVEVWLTRAGCCIFGKDSRAVILTPPRSNDDDRGGSSLGLETRCSHAVARHFIESGRRTYAGAIHASEESRRDRQANKKLQKWQRRPASKPCCALEAIAQALEIPPPEESSASSLEKVKLLTGNLNEGAMSGADTDAVARADSRPASASVENVPIEVVHNAPVIMWRRAHRRKGGVRWGDQGAGLGGGYEASPSVSSHTDSDKEKSGVENEGMSPNESSPPGANSRRGTSEHDDQGEEDVLVIAERVGLIRAESTGAEEPQSNDVDTERGEGAEEGGDAKGDGDRPEDDEEWVERQRVIQEREERMEEIVRGIIGGEVHGFNAAIRSLQEVAPFDEMRGDPVLIGFLMDCIESGRAVVRVTGVQLLEAYAEAGDELVIPVLQEMMVHDEDEAARMAASDALLRLDP